MLRFHATRPTSGGLEGHLATLSGLVLEFKPQLVIIDPITAFNLAGNEERVKLMLMRAVDLFKSQGITSLFTALTFGGDAPESTSVGISSLIDTWLLLRNLEMAGERTRALYVLKARGMAHSNKIREFLLTDDGIKLVDVMLDADGRILTGSSRQLYKQQQENSTQERNIITARRRTVLENRRQALEARIVAMRAEFEQEHAALEAELTSEDSIRSSAERSLDNAISRRSSASQVVQ
jgi:circadian clock protein KaiC